MLQLVLLASLVSGPHPSFEALALSWRGDAEAVRVRASADGVIWSEWIEAQIDGDLSTEGEYFSGIVHFGREMRFVETSRDVKVTTFELQRGPRRRAAPDGLSLGGIPIRSRSEWGCPDGEGSRWTPAYTPVTHAIVHHTAGLNSLPDWDAEMRDVWQFHTFGRGWGDIGYNFLIAPNGVIYEGRAGGNNAIAAHFSCRNTNTVGIALLGTYTSVAPTQAAQTSLVALLTEICRRNGLDPSAVSLHVPTALNLPRIAGHRDGNASTATCSKTECPGEVLFSMLPAIRASIIVPPVPRRRAVTTPRP